MVRALHLDLTGRPVPPPSPAYGRRFVAENYALLSLLAVPRRRWAAETGGVRRRTEWAWCAADDPLPALAMGRAWLAHLLRKALRALRRRWTSGRDDEGRPRGAGAPGAGPVPVREPRRVSR